MVERTRVIMNQKIEIAVNVVAYEHDGRWIAQCVEYDIAAFADSLVALPDAVFDAVSANFCINQHLGRNGLDGIPAAPVKFRELFETASLDVHQRNQDVSLPPSVRVKEIRVA
jgi:hypothetical protein